MFSTPIHTNQQSIDRVLHAGLPVLLVFERKHCDPCRALDSALASSAAALVGRVLIARIDVDDNPELAKRYDVADLPALVFARDGQAAARVRGAVDEGALRSWLEALLEGRSVPAPSGATAPLRQQPQPSGPPPASRPQPVGAQSGAPITITDANFDRIVGGATPVLVDFWAPWCGPCRAVAPAVEQLAREFAGRAVVAKLNVDDNPRTAQRFGISGIPALLIFKNGSVVERLVGAQPAPVIRQALARHAG